MSHPKKNIARLVLQGISILGILFGIFCFCSVIAMILSIQRDTLSILSSLIASGVGFVLGAYLIYYSYLMLRGRAFGLLKSISALLALTFFGLVIPHAEDLNTYFNGKIQIEIKAFVDLAPFLLIAFVSVLIYKICKKLFDRLVVAVYGPEIISETKPTTDKQ